MSATDAEVSMTIKQSSRNLQVESISQTCHGDAMDASSKIPEDDHTEPPMDTSEGDVTALVSRPSSKENVMSSTSAFSLLDLPDEIIEEILLNVPPAALQVCLSVHPKFDEIINGKVFLDNYTRRQLGFSDMEVKFDTLPKHFAPSLELWYLSNAAVLKCDWYCQTVDRSSMFFPLVCFKHSLYTWLTLARFFNVEIDNTDKCIPRDSRDHRECNHRRCSMPMDARTDTLNRIATSRKCYRLMGDNPPHLPGYMARALVKICLALPNFIEDSIYAPILSLHPGVPVSLWRSWNKHIQHLLPSDARPSYCLEIILCFDSRSQNAILVLFYPNMCFLWIGRVGDGSRYKHLETTVLQPIPVDAPLFVLGKSLYCMDFVLVTTCADKRRCPLLKLSRLYPGVCHTINTERQARLLALLNLRINFLAKKILSLISGTSLKPSGTAKHKRVALKLPRVLRKFGVEFTSYYPKNDVSDVPSDQCSLSNHTCPDTQSQAQSCDAKRIAEDIRSALHKIFSPRAMHFVGNAKCHKIICKKCSGLKPSQNNQMDKCLMEAYCSGMPISIWPFHLIAKALEIVDFALKVYYGDISSTVSMVAVGWPDR